MSKLSRLILSIQKGTVCVHNLTAITALGQSMPKVKQIGAVTCNEIPDIALASVAYRLGKEKPAAVALQKLLGVLAPGSGLVAGTKLSAFWIGPDQWMIEAPYDTHEDLADKLRGPIKGAASVTDQSDAWVRFDLTGGGMLDVLERICNLNTRSMKPSTASRTSVEHLGCFVICRTASCFSIIGPSSSAGSLYHTLITAMLSGT